MSTFQKTLSKNKLIVALFVTLLAFGVYKDALFLMAAPMYLGLIASAYYVGSKISDYTINAFYSWSIKWAVFILYDVFSKTEAGRNILTECVQSFCTSKPAGHNATDREVHMNDGKRELISEILNQIQIGEKL